MKRLPQQLAFLLLSTCVLGLWACGTEVGNGLKPKKKREPEQTKTVEDNTTTTSAPESAGTMNSNESWQAVLLTPCASPFAENVPATLANSTESFSITRLSNTQLRITDTVTDAAPLSGTITILTATTSPYDIDVSSAGTLRYLSSSAICGSVTTTTDTGSDGYPTTTRTLTVQQQGLWELTWTLGGAAPATVREIRVKNTVSGSTYTLVAP